MNVFVLLGPLNLYIDCNKKTIAMKSNLHVINNNETSINFFYHCVYRLDDNQSLKEFFFKYSYVYTYLKRSLFPLASVAYKNCSANKDCNNPVHAKKSLKFKTALMYTRLDYRIFVLRGSVIKKKNASTANFKRAIPRFLLHRHIAVLDRALLLASLTYFYLRNRHISLIAIN